MGRGVFGNWFTLALTAQMALHIMDLDQFNGPQEKCQLKTMSERFFQALTATLNKFGLQGDVPSNLEDQFKEVFAEINDVIDRCVTDKCTEELEVRALVRMFLTCVAAI
jgi:hypothetical protein